MYIIFICVLSVILHAAITILGRHSLCFIMKRSVSKLFGLHRPNISYGLSFYETEDFRKKLKEFFKTITLTNYLVDDSGWLEITYDICDVEDQNKSTLKRAICLELHTYLLSNHGINAWNYYVHTLTDTVLIIRIAMSPLAQEEFSALNFEPAKTLKQPVMSDD